MKYFRMTMVFVWVVLLAGMAFSAQPQIGLKDLMISAELDFKQIHEARNAALALEQPTTIYLPEGIMIDVLGVEDSKPVYAVITNLAHPSENGYTAFYEQIESEFDLSNARIHYGKERVVRPKLGFPSERGVVQGDLLLVGESSNDRVMALDPMTGDLVDADFIPSNPGALSTPQQAHLTPWGTISVSDQIADVVSEFDTSGVFLRTLAPAGGPNTSIVDNMRGHEYRENGNLIVTSAAGANADAIPEFDQNGNYLGNFIANGAGGLASPWGIWYRANDILITGINSDNILSFDFNGNFLSQFAPVDNFPEQVAELSDGSVAVGNFSGTQQGVVIFDANGAFQRTLTGVSGNRGVFHLGNGNIITTNGGGVHELDFTTGNLVRTIISGVSSHMVSLYSFAPSGPVPGTLYASTGDAGDTLITVDPGTGQGTAVAPHGAFGPVTEIEFRNDGVLFGSTGQGTSYIITIDPVTGVEDTLGGMHPFGAVNGLEFDDSGNLLGTFFNTTSTELVIIDQTTGQFSTTIGPTGVQIITGLAFHPNGTLYGVGHSGAGSPSNLYTIDVATGAATLVGAVGIDNVGALEFGPDGILYGGVGSQGGSFAGHLITIDPATGAGTDVGPTGFGGVSGLSFYPVQINIVTNPDTVVFDTTYVNNTSDQILEVGNTGNDTLIVTNVTSSNPAFSPDMTAFNVNPGGSVDVTITFAPTTAGVETGWIVVENNDPNNPQDSTAVFGVAVDAAIADITPNFNNPVQVGQDDSTDVTITILNGVGPSGAQLVWSASVGDNPATAKSSRHVSMAKPTVSDAVEASPNATPLPAAYIEAPFDLQFSYNLEAITGALGNAGSEFDGTYFYTTRWASNLLHKIDMNGTLVEEFSISGVTGLRDLAYDGTYMYGGAAANTIYQMDFNTKTLIGTISSPVAVRHISYDEGADAFWVGNWNTQIALVDRNGNTLAAILAATHGLAAMYGSAYDSYSSGGPYLWVYDQGSGAGTPQFIHQLQLPSGSPTGVSFDVASVISNNGIAGGLWVGEGIEPGLATVGGVQQGTPDMLFGLELVATAPPWIRLVGATSGTLDPGDQFDLTVRLYGITDRDTAYVNINTNDPTLPVASIEVVIDTVSTGIGDLPEIPNTFGIAQNYPNPFNPTTTFAYQLPRQSDVRLVIYNVLGQKVRTLINGPMEAGYHSVVWDGRNDKGMQAASGVYIYRFEAGDYVTTMKMMLLK